ncbi:hypothetical protein JOQ06_003670, partial [Pogonophryne albipinna]
MKRPLGERELLFTVSLPNGREDLKAEKQSNRKTLKECDLPLTYSAHVCAQFRVD